MVSKSFKLFIYLIVSFSLVLQPLSLKAMDSQDQSKQIELKTQFVINKFERSLLDGTANEAEIKEISQELAKFTFGVLTDPTLSEARKKRILTDVVKRFGKVLYQFTDPFDDPIRVNILKNAPFYEYFFKKGQVILKTLIRDLTYLPIGQNDAAINKLGQVPIQAFIDVLDTEIENINEGPSKQEILDFYHQLSKSMEEMEPYAHRYLHGSIYNFYLWLTVYLALIDRPDWVGLVTMDFNYWSPLFSAMSLAAWSGYLTYVRYVSTGRGILNKHKELNKKIHYLETGERPKDSKVSSVINRITSIGQGVASFCERVLTKNTKN